MNILPFLIAIGTYTANTGSKGIYILELDMDKQQSRIIYTLEANNPSFLHFSKTTSTLYYVEEIGSGTVNAASYNQKTGTLERISSFSTVGNSPCHVAVSPDETTLIASNYSSGNFATFSLLPDGRINEKQSDYAFEGSSIHPSRQKQSYIHSAFYTPNSQKVYVQDLGGDHIYQFDAKDITKENSTFQTHDMPAGSGPRHLTFSADNKFVYIVNELNGTIDVYNLDDHSQIDKHLQHSSTDSTTGDNLCAHIRLSPDGKFLYASNRGEKNSLSVFGVKTDGTLQFLQVIASEGRSPRHFEFSADGNWLIVAHQHSNNLSVFARDQTTGLLSFSGLKIDIPAPVCVALL